MKDVPIGENEINLIMRDSDRHRTEDHQKVRIFKDANAEIQSSKQKYMDAAKSLVKSGITKLKLRDVFFTKDSIAANIKEQNKIITRLEKLERHKTFRTQPEQRYLSKEGGQNTTEIKARKELVGFLKQKLKLEKIEYELNKLDSSYKKNKELAIKANEKVNGLAKKGDKLKTSLSEYKPTEEASERLNDVFYQLHNEAQTRDKYIENAAKKLAILEQWQDLNASELESIKTKDSDAVTEQAKKDRLEKLIDDVTRNVYELESVRKKEEEERIASNKREKAQNKLENYLSKRNKAFLIAVEKGKMKTVETLIDRGVNLEVANKDGNTSLHVSAERGYVDICKLILQSYIKQLSENEKDDEGRKNKFLVFVNLKNNEDRTALDLSEEKRNGIDDGTEQAKKVDEVISLLKEIGGKKTWKDVLQWSNFSVASETPLPNDYEGENRKKDVMASKSKRAGSESEGGQRAIVQQKQIPEKREKNVDRSRRFKTGILRKAESVKTPVCRRGELVEFLLNKQRELETLGLSVQLDNFIAQNVNKQLPWATKDATKVFETRSGTSEGYVIIDNITILNPSGEVATVSAAFNKEGEISLQETYNNVESSYTRTEREDGVVIQNIDMMFPDGYSKGDSETFYVDLGSSVNHMLAELHFSVDGNIICAGFCMDNEDEMYKEGYTPSVARNIDVKALTNILSGENQKRIIMASFGGGQIKSTLNSIILDKANQLAYIKAERPGSPVSVVERLSI